MTTVKFFLPALAIGTVLLGCSGTIIGDSDTQPTGDQLIRHAQGEFSSLSGFTATGELTLPETDWTGQLEFSYDGQCCKLDFSQPQWLSDFSLTWDPGGMVAQYGGQTFELGDNWEGQPALWLARCPQTLLEMLQTVTPEEVDGQLVYTLTGQEPLPALTCNLTVDGVALQPTQMEMICGDQVAVLRFASFTPAAASQNHQQEGT